MTAYPLIISGTLLGIHIMGKLLGMGDTAMVMVGSTAHALARVVFAVAEVSWLFYVGKIHVNFQFPVSKVASGNVICWILLRSCNIKLLTQADMTFQPCTMPIALFNLLFCHITIFFNMCKERNHFIHLFI